ncbi:MAG: DNA polymerase I, partial [Anaerolineae bacterium]|nr:DNA polymerase I [Anaerolineae bacterium]
MPPTLYLIDGHALAYRTYFALTGAGGSTSRWVTAAGEPTAGIFGFTSVLLRILEQERPDYLAVAFDTGKTFRDDMFPDYKATREKMPDDLRTQIERIRQLVDTFNIPRLETEGYEADDVLGSISRRVAAEGLGVKIITGDQDLLQLVTDRIIVSLPGRKLSESQDYLPGDVFAKLGVRPDQVVDYKAMVGDKSDNIPGVVGVGKKTAESLLGAYETLDGVYSHLDELKPGTRKKLETDREKAYLSRDLAAIVTDLDISLDLDQARTDKFDPKAVQSLFRDLEFRSLIPRLNAVMGILGMAAAESGEQMQMFSSPSGSAPAPADLDVETVIVDTPDKLKALGKTLAAAKVIAFDTETTSTDQMEAELVGISLAVDPDLGYYIPVGHAPSHGEQLPMDEVIKVLEPSFTSPHVPKAGHNLKYDFIVLSRHGLDAAPLSFDSMLAEWICNPGSRNLGLKNLAWIRLDLEMTEISALIGSGKNQVTMAQVPIKQAAP